MDWCFYLDTYPDLRKNGVLTEQQAIQHWNDYGKQENRIPFFHFDWKIYLDKYPDLRQNGIHTEQQAINHWFSYGKNEGRTNYIFEWNSYLDTYPDLRQNGILTEQQAIDHWLNYGKKEGRICSNEHINKIIGDNMFDFEFYKEQYHDLKDLTLHEIVNHYIN
jgi:hypothetical protein